MELKLKWLFLNLVLQLTLSACGKGIRTDLPPDGTLDDGGTLVAEIANGGDCLTNMNYFWFSNLTACYVKPKKPEDCGKFGGDYRPADIEYKEQPACYIPNQGYVGFYEE